LLQGLVKDYKAVVEIIIVNMCIIIVVVFIVLDKYGKTRVRPVGSQNY
jgi:hypothetical protein